MGKQAKSFRLDRKVVGVRIPSGAPKFLRIVYVNRIPSSQEGELGLTPNVGAKVGKKSKLQLRIDVHSFKRKMGKLFLEELE